MIGYVSLNHDFFGRYAKYLLLDSLFISRTYRGKGIGKTLVKYCIDKAESWGQINYILVLLQQRIL